ncbi:tRNA (adenosine(37)-N6)-dimethylallyltransferase MiaA [Patescibacteria group bacterium]|nr:MAG: tRNA (adenosine(37)-N6)-dimethylallyltransferase MiaA [Patescibacteria group bacterium]
MNPPKLLVICGPTATGKSDLAVELAKNFNGEIISADSRQVYRDLDIGSGKITKKEMLGIPHHLLDVADPKEVFSVEKYKTLAQKAISEIISRKKLPIICGGTGFYIHYVIDDVSVVEVAQDESLRAELSKKTPAELFSILQTLDPDRAENIDAQNPVRLIRAIEIATALGKVPPISTNSPYDVLQIGIDLPDEELKAKIRTRLEKRLARGMIEEVEKLVADGVSWERLHAFGLEYRYVANFLKKETTENEMREKLLSEIWHYAKRQRTWFRKDKRIQWFNPSKKEKILAAVKNFLSK